MSIRGTAAICQFRKQTEDDSAPCGISTVGSAPPCHGGGHEFESRMPLIKEIGQQILWIHNDHQKSKQAGSNPTTLSRLCVVSLAVKSLTSNQRSPDRPRYDALKIPQQLYILCSHFYAL